MDALRRRLSLLLYRLRLGWLLGGRFLLLAVRGRKTGLFLLLDESLQRAELCHAPPDLVARVLCAHIAAGPFESMMKKLDERATKCPRQAQRHVGWRRPALVGNPIVFEGSSFAEVNVLITPP